MLNYQALEDSIKENSQFLLDSFSNTPEINHLSNILEQSQVKALKSVDDEKDNLKELKLEKFKLGLLKPIAWLKGNNKELSKKYDQVSNKIRAIREQGVDAHYETKQIHLSVESLKEYSKSDFNALNDNEVLDFVYFHEMGHIFQHENVKIDSFVNALPLSTQNLLNQKSENDQIKPTQMFLLSNNQEKLKYNLVSSFLLENVLIFDQKENHTDNLAPNIQRILKTTLSECFADTYGVLLKTKKNGNLEKNIEKIMAIRKEGVVDYKHMTHFTYYGISQIKEILKEKNLSIDSLSLNDIQQVAKEVASISLHKNLYTFLKKFESIKEAMQNTLFDAVHNNSQIEFELILGQNYKTKSKTELFETYEKFIMKKVGLEWTQNLKSEMQRQFVQKEISMPIVEAKTPELTLAHHMKI